MRNYQIHDTAELHELIMTTRVNWIIYQKGGQMHKIEFCPNIGYPMELSAHLFHAINWYLAAHTTIPPFLTPEHGMVQHQSGSYIRKIGKIFLMPENWEDPDAEIMKNNFREITERLKLKEDFFDDFFPDQDGSISQSQAFARFCLRHETFFLRPVHPLGYSYGRSGTRYARSRNI